MTADVELPPPWQCETAMCPDLYTADQVRACVAHAIAAKDAEIAHERWLREQAENRCVAVEDQREALRAEVVRWRTEATEVANGAAIAVEAAEASADQLAEALREIKRRMPEGQAGAAWIARSIASSALLREQENDDA